MSLNEVCKDFFYDRLRYECGPVDYYERWHYCWISVVKKNNSIDIIATRQKYVRNDRIVISNRIKENNQYY